MTALPDRPGPARGVVAGKLRVPHQDTLARERLHALLDNIWRQRLALVIAPAGSGKTSLLAGFARGAGVPVAWYRAESWDGHEATLVHHLEQALTAALPGLAAGWETIEDAAGALDARAGGPTLLVIDDLHNLEGSQAEAALERLIEYAPPWLAFLVGSRVQPGFNLSRWRVSGSLLEIGADDLRFRSWEVERLFRDFYGAQIPPQELATLARRTEGWAAGLQLFHLATRGKSPEERRQLLAAAGRSTRLTREYLASNVVGALDPEVREFLLDTCAMGRRLNAPLCDQLRNSTGSRAILDDLERRGVFTVRLDDDDASYRYHEVLRGYLDWLLIDTLGHDAHRERYRRAGEILEGAGWAAEALDAYCRAEDWAAVQRLLGRDGERLVGAQGPWLEHLPPAIVRRDPWLILATARWARAEGRWSHAVDAYLRAEVAFGRSPFAEVCRAERLAIAAWLQASPPPSLRDWSGLLRAAVTRDPAAAGRDAATLPSAAERGLVRGLTALLGGQVREARRELLDAAERPGLSPALAAAARLGGGVAALLAGDVAGVTILERAIQEAEAANAPWLAMLARAMQTIGLGDVTVPVQMDPDEGQDPWGEGLSLLALGLGAATPEDRRHAAEAAERGFRRLGAGALEAWARGLGAVALADAGSPDAREAGSAAEAVARSSGTPGLRLFGFLAMARSDAEHGAAFESLASAISDETGLSGPATVRALAQPGRSTPPTSGLTRASRGAPSAEPLPSVEVRCLGAFSLSLHGVKVDMAAIKPRSRSLLRYLALHAGATVHREVIAEALWPDTDAATASRSLQVGISTLRGLLEPEAGRGGAQLVVRTGEGYRLVLPKDAFVDVAAFEAAVVDGRTRRTAGDLSAAAAAFGRAIDLYSGDLLAEDGPAEWVVERREALRTRAAEAAAQLADVYLLRDDTDAAAQACRAGLAIDRYHDPLWRLLIESRDRAGDTGAAGKARHEYESVLATLGVVGGTGETAEDRSRGGAEAAGRPAAVRYR